MPLQALLLLIAAAFFHTGWNFLVKRVVAKQIFTWWTLVVGCLFYIPLIGLHWPIPPGIWLYAVASALAETAPVNQQFQTAFYQQRRLSTVNYLNR